MDQKISVNPQRAAQLQALLDQPLFPARRYHPGLQEPSDARREEWETLFRTLLTTLQDDPGVYQTKQLVLAEFRPILKAGKKYPAADKEELCWAFEQILDLYGIESSDGLLENWLHGILL